MLRRPVGGLDVELVVDTSEATEALSASASSLSEASPSRALRRREVLVGRGLGRVVDLAEEPGARRSLGFGPLAPLQFGVRVLFGRGKWRPSVRFTGVRFLVG